MNSLLQRVGITVGTLVVGAMPFSCAFAAASLSVQSVSPSDTVPAESTVTFKITVSGFAPTSFAVRDSFAASTLTNQNVNSAGDFLWVPDLPDIGTHTLSISATDASGAAASTTQTITVLPLPSISIQSIAPGTSVMPGSALTFVVVPQGFTNPSYSVSDSFGGSTAPTVSIDSGGHFSWTPDASQNGQHNLSVYAQDAGGHRASVSAAFLVGPGPTLTIRALSPGASVQVGQSVTFTVANLNFSPTAFGASDHFTGATTLSNSNISLSGVFSWIPQVQDVGTHVITVVGSVGAAGDSASTTQAIQVVPVGASTSTLPALPATAAAAAAIANTTSTSSPSLLEALLAQVALVQAQIAALTAGTSTPASAVSATSASPAHVFTTFIGYGQNGAEVMALQNRLKDLGFLTATPNGHFGKATLAALKAFQTAHGIRAAGYAGPATRAALNGQ